MNAAARLVHQNGLTRHLVLTNLLSLKQIVFIVLTLGILASAISSIYITQITRDLHARIQQSNVEHDKLQIQRGQLLLERSTLMMQARVEQIAAKNLGMIIPDYKSVVIVHE